MPGSSARITLNVSRAVNVMKRPVHAVVVSCLNIREKGVQILIQENVAAEIIAAVAVELNEEAVGPAGYVDAGAYPAIHAARRIAAISGQITVIYRDPGRRNPPFR